MKWEPYKAIYDAYYDATILVDHLGIIVSANKRADELFGYQKDELAGCLIKAIIPFGISQAGESSPSLNGREHHGQAGYFNIRAIRKNGSPFHAEMRISRIDIDPKSQLVIFVRLLPDGASLLPVFSQAIKEVENCSVVFMTCEGVIIWSCGVEQVYGMKDDDMEGRYFEIFYSEEERNNQFPSKLLKNSLEQGRVIHEGWMKGREGAPFWGSLVIEPVKNNGGLVGFLQMTKDLTPIKKTEKKLTNLEEALEAKNKELDNFAYIASHDLQEPLSTIKGMVDLLKMENKGQFTAETDTYLTFLEGGVQNARALIMDLLDYSRLGRSRELEKLKVGQVVAEAFDEIQMKIDAARAEIAVGPMPEITACRVELITLFRHLIDNAIKFTRPGVPPYVKIDAQEEDDHWSFSIEDNGVGIPQKYLEIIFVIFKRVNKQRSSEGNGIGLAYCKKIVNLHKGVIWAESVYELGSCFYFTISKNLGEFGKE